jgi:stage II sporulation protein D
LRSLTPPPYLTDSAGTPPLARRRRSGLRALSAALTAVVLTLGCAAGARANTMFYIRGGGDGHGIGMSQYGAYGYALHGADYRSILSHYYQGTALATTAPGRMVRVLLPSGSTSFSGATSAGRTRLLAATTYRVTETGGGSLRLSTVAGTAVGTFAAPLTVSGPAPLQISHLGAYRGSLQFSVSGSGVQTVDAVGLDDYVRGVVAAEMPASWAPAALQAQAVAARTYAITTTVGGHGYDLYSDTRSQMYGGVAAETPSTDAAVAATSGQIVTYGGQPAVTYFFSSSGGHTESIENVWAGSTPEPWLRGVSDPYDGAGQDPYHSWGSQMSLSAASAKLAGLVRGTLVGIQVTRHGVSPRIVQAQIVGTRGRTTVTGPQLQGIFGLDSTDAAFTTISTQDPPGSLRGTVFPVPAGGSVTVEASVAGVWRPLSQAVVSGSGAFSTVVPAGRYRIADGAITGPVVTVS